MLQTGSSSGDDLVVMADQGCREGSYFRLSAVAQLVLSSFGSDGFSGSV
jgi:hypothetical protein